MSYDHTLIVSAADFEVAPLKHLAPTKNFALEFMTIGIGPLQAAKNALLLAKKVAKRRVIFLGTCGVLGAFHNVRLVTPIAVRWLPTCERMGASSAISGLNEPISFCAPKTANLDLATVLCCPNISYSSTLSPKLNDNLKGLVVENLELYSIANELKQAHSLSILFAITNEVCKVGRRQWQQNYLLAAQLSAQYVIKYMLYTDPV